MTTQVSDQLAGGAAAAAQSAGQLEDVVDQLRRVVGGRAAQDTPEPEDSRNVVPAGRSYGQQPGAAQRALPAPASPMNGYPGEMAPHAPSLYGTPAGPHQPYGVPGDYEANGGYGGYPGNGWGTPPGNQPNGGYNGMYGAGINADRPGRATNGPGVQVWEDR